MSQSPAVIEVSGVRKSFRVPLERDRSLRDAITHPFHSAGVRELLALREVSFEVRQGEFFGIAGRNGSGKSTLLKLLASIYRADRGRIRVAGRLAPFIELGVGFNPELPARDNVTLNGVLMGLSRREAEHRFDRVMDFAELGEFADLKLKNYSSGMQVRLAFAVMLEVEADILLFDEVLAVGDAGFQEKCAEALAALRAGPQTIVLVTHAMPQLQMHCERAMLLEDGVVQVIGDPDLVVGEYMKVTLDEAHRSGAYGHLDIEHVGRLRGVGVVGATTEPGSDVVELGDGEPIHLRGELEVSAPVERPAIAFEVLTVAGVHVFFSEISPLPGCSRLEAGERAPFSIKVDNPLAPGVYVVRIGIARLHPDGTVTSLGPPAQIELRLGGGSDPDPSGAPPFLVRLDYELEAG